MRNLVPVSSRRWRVPLARDVTSWAGGDDGGDSDGGLALASGRLSSATLPIVDGSSDVHPGDEEELVVASCYDGEARVMYAVTSACTLYGMCIAPPGPAGMATHASSSLPGGAGGARDAASMAADGGCCLVLSLLGGTRGDERSGSSGTLGEQEEEEEEAALPTRADIVGMEYIIELAGVCIAAASGELILVAPDDSDDTATGGGGSGITSACVPECVGVVASGLRAMCWNPDGELLMLATGAGTLICMTKDFFVLSEAPVAGGVLNAGGIAATLSW